MDDCHDDDLCMLVHDFKWHTCRHTMQHRGRHDFVEMNIHTVDMGVAKSAEATNGTERHLLTSESPLFCATPDVTQGKAAWNHEERQREGGRGGSEGTDHARRRGRKSGRDRKGRRGRRVGQRGGRGKGRGITFTSPMASKPSI
jgi:hypothetical protein